MLGLDAATTSEVSRRLTGTWRILREHGADVVVNDLAELLSKS